MTVFSRPAGSAGGQTPAAVGRAAPGSAARFVLARPARPALRTAHVALGIGWTGLAAVMLVLPSRC